MRGVGQYSQMEGAAGVVATTMPSLLDGSNGQVGPPSGLQSPSRPFSLPLALVAPPNTFIAVQPDAGDLKLRVTLQDPYLNYM